MKRNKIRIFTIISAGLIMLFSFACTNDNFHEGNAATYNLDLCVAVLSEGNSYALLLDNGYTILPENEISTEIEIGNRYRVHYCVTNPLGDSLYNAHILDIYSIGTFDLIPRVLSGDASKERTPVRVERIWIGGNYLNITFSFMMSDGGIAHTIKLVRNNFANDILTLDLMHYDNGDAHNYSVTTTASFPLSSIWEYSKAKTIAVRVIEPGDDNSIMNTYSVPGGKIVK